MKKLFLIFAVFYFPFSLFADETATSSVTVNVRYQDTLVFSGPVVITKNTNANISDNTGVNRSVASASAIIALKTADDLSDNFILSDLVYYADFGSLYVNCIDIVSLAKHACANWQYVVNETYPPIGMDKYILSDNDVLYLYFGNPRRVLLSSPSVQTATPFQVKTENYDYVNNAWTILSGATIGATQTNPDDPYSPLVISSATSDENGFAELVLGTSGSYNVGLAMDYYFPAETLAVLEPKPPEGSGPGANNRAKSQIQMIETVMIPLASNAGETVAENKTQQEITKLPVINETRETKEIIIKMDISMDNFIEKYNIALQNQKSQAREKSRNKTTNESLMVYNDKNIDEGQMAGAIVALKSRETWIKKVFSKISDFLRFKNKNE